jgi:RecB family exonuclease
VTFRAAREPRTITRFSPSTVNSLAACAYRVALLRDGGLPARQSLAAALGIVAHGLHERYWRGDFDGLEAANLRLALATGWDELIGNQRSDLEGAYQPAEVPPPSEWPGYALTKARTIGRLEAAPRQAAGARRRGDWRRAEIELADSATGLFGRVDRLEWFGGRLRIVDLKAGLLQADATESQRRQLLLYAWLVNAAYGEWPAEVIIETAAGDETLITVDPAHAQAEVESAARLVGNYNDAAVAGWTALAALAQPSDLTCRGCSARIACEPFWEALTSGWSRQGAVRGDISTVATIRGTSMSITLTTTEPTDRTGTPTAIYQVPVKAGIEADRRIAIVGAERRGDPGNLRWRWDAQLSVWDKSGAAARPPRPGRGMPPRSLAVVEARDPVRPVRREAP